MTTTAEDPLPGRNQAVGAYGERVAACHLAAAGMVVLDRNWRCAEGELDLVLRDGDALVACEVKTRTSLEHGSPHEAITDAKLGRLQRLAQRWVAEHGVSPPEVRVDLVAVLRPTSGAALVEHVRGIG
jgi:putative endonuclease